MKQYTDLVNDIINNGELHHDRTGVGTKRVWVRSIRHNLQDGFPLLTTKKMAVKSSFVEMLGFIRGEIDINWYKSRGCNIWNANHEDWHGNQLAKDQNIPEKIQSVNYRKNNPNSLGYVYGFQWRNMNGFDQLAYILSELRKKSNSRRLIMSAWNPSEFDMMCLPPCHVMYHFSVRGNFLDISMTQRSCDVGLGVPFNLANTALLCHIMAHCSGLIPGEMVWTGNDVHIYTNHIDQLTEQVLREPRELPKLIIKNNDIKDPWNFEFDDFEIQNYNPHPPIKMQMAV